MRIVIGGTLLTLGCLLALGAGLTTWLAIQLPGEAELPGRGGLPALVAFAFTGWAGLACVVGSAAVRRSSPATPDRASVLVVTVAGTLFGCGAYFYETAAPKPPKFPGEPANDVALRIRGFGTIIHLSGGSRVKWTDSKGRTTSDYSEGFHAKGALLFTGLTLTYGAAGGLLAGGLFHFLRGRGVERPRQSTTPRE